MPSNVFLDRALNVRHPETFGRYQLLGRIAIGGMAEVYVARCGELMGLQTLIALKRILPVHAADDSFVRMFQREASIALRLQHSNIARVFEVGKVNDSWFLSMELVQGENVARASKRLRSIDTPWSQELLAFIGSEVARALDYAHGLKDAKGRHLGIVHRDISPENIMLGFDGSVRVIDFGIALCEMYARETTAGAVRGKVQYVSPEQALGRTLDGRSDIFSLGVVLYEALAGVHPFDRTTTMATLDAVVKEEAPPLAHASDALNKVLARAMAKNPAMRFQTAGEFGKALLGTITDRTVGNAANVSELVASLFPGRTSRWKQIQEMAGAGVGFTQDLVTPEPTALSDLETRSDNLYVATPEKEAVASPRLWGRPRVAAVAAGTAALVALAGIGLIHLMQGPGSPPPAAASQATAAAAPVAVAPPGTGMVIEPMAPPAEAPPAEPAPIAEGVVEEEKPAAKPAKKKRPARKKHTASARHSKKRR